MNGRVYDPKLGRMLSPDPVTQAPENGQNYNRYTYAYNNPLKYTDPSGFQMEEVVVQGSGSSGCCYAGWDGGYQPYNGKGNHALDLLFAARIHYNMTEGLRLKLAPGFEKLRVEEGDWLGAFIAVEAQIEGDKIASDGNAMEETLVVGKRPDDGTIGLNVALLEDSQMTLNSDGNWQFRTNAAFAAAGLDASTVTHGCLEVKVGACAFFNTLIGSGDTSASDVIEATGDATDVLANSTSKFRGLNNIYLQGALYFGSWGTRLQSNTKACAASCGKEEFER